ncbi:UNVERIFIED_CONTAM: movement protein [Sesamum radiatum]|uniref:Movement protein n=1 Tax=Sesamum radiatum TaxID=300843 RepID=A0AAW2VQT1_SESRA
MQDPHDESLQRELLDEPIPEPMKILKIATVGSAEQRVTYLQTARRNMLNYVNLKPQMTSLMQSIMAIWYLSTNSRTFLQTKVSMRRRKKLIRMDFQSSQSNYNEGDRLQISESLSGFFSRMTISNKTMERIMRQDFNLSPYNGFRIGGINRVLNKIGLNQRKHHIIYKVSSSEFVILIEPTRNVMEMQLIPKEEIFEELSKLREEVAVTMKWIHIGAIEVVIKATFKEEIDSEIHLSIMDRKINNLRDGCLGTMIGNLYAGKLIFDIHPRIAYNLADQDFSRVLTLHQDFKRKDLMKEGNRPYSITYRIAYRMLEIAGHEILVAAYIDSGSGICIAKPEVFPREAMKILPVIAGRNFLQKILILNKEIRKAKIMIGGAFGTPWFRDKRKFGKVLLSFRQQRLIDSDSFYEESEKEIKNLKKTLQEIKSLDISEESKLSLENVKRLI